MIEERTLGEGPTETKDALEVDVLIIGAGPSGATLGLLLGRMGISCLAVSRHIGTANTPRAHMVNQRALEVLRDAGIEADILRDATKRPHMDHVTWVHSLAGEEYARLYWQGAAPARKGEFDAASPCETIDLPQIRMEPILIKKAEEVGVKIWWRTEFVAQSDVESEDRVETIVRNRDSGVETTIRSKYLIGADGARSPVLESLDIPVDGRKLNSVYNVHFKANLHRFMDVRPAILNWILNSEAPQWSSVCNIRMVRPWTEFAVSMHPATPEGGGPFEPTPDDIRTRLYQLFGAGKDVVGEIEILSISRWHVNDQVARTYQKGRVICLGDAVHRHPPINGLGSNTCISDAMNLSWKLAYVVHGRAHPRILSSFTPERKPVGDGVVRRANEGMEEHRRLWKVIGLDAEERQEKLAVMASATAAGSALREQWKTAIWRTDREANALGIQLNQQYCSSPLTVFEADDAGKPDLSGIDLVMTHVVTTYPGWHLPHAWVVRDGQSARRSTLDLCGRGRFTLLTGIGGEAWRQFAREVELKRPGLEVVVVSIGWRQDYHDAYGDWARVRGVEDDGAVLVRPDHFVSWRCSSASKVAASTLGEVMDRVLGWSLDA